MRIQLEDLRASAWVNGRLVGETPCITEIPWDRYNSSSTQQCEVRVVSFDGEVYEAQFDCFWVSTAIMGMPIQVALIEPILGDATCTIMIRDGIPVLSFAANAVQPATNNQEADVNSSAF